MRTNCDCVGPLVVPLLQDPVVVLVKEYLPGAKAVACNELQVCSAHSSC
jgi:hypothetical protein